MSEYPLLSVYIDIVHDHIMEDMGMEEVMYHGRYGGGGGSVENSLLPRFSMCSIIVYISDFLYSDSFFLILLFKRVLSHVVISPVFLSGFNDYRTTIHCI